MAVNFDALASVTGTAVGSLTTSSFTIGSGANRAFVLGVGNTQAGITVSSTSCGGVSGTSVGARVITGNNSVHLWYGVAPASGSQTASVTFSDTWGTGLFLAAHTFDGVDQVTPVSDYTTTTGSSTSATLTVTNVTTGDYVVDTINNPSGGNKTAGADQTREFFAAGSGASSIQAGASGGVMSWTIEFSSAYAQAGVRVAQSAGRTAKNTHAWPLGSNLGIGVRMG